MTRYKTTRAHGWRWMTHRKVYIDHCRCPMLPLDEVDHIDRDPLNNDISNLRRASRGDNHRNRRAYGASGIKGVYKNGEWWTVRPHDRFGKPIYLGNVKTLEEAVALLRNVK